MSPAFERGQQQKSAEKIPAFTQSRQTESDLLVGVFWGYLSHVATAQSINQWSVQMAPRSAILSNATRSGEALLKRCDLGVAIVAEENKGCPLCVLHAEGARAAVFRVERADMVIEISVTWPDASRAAELAEVVPTGRPEEDPIQEILREVFGD